MADTLIHPAYRGEGLNLPLRNRAVVTTGLDIYSAGAKIGFCQSITLTDARAVNLVRHLDMVAAGRPIELVPQVEEITGSLTGMEIYNNIFPARLSGKPLTDQLNSAGEGVPSRIIGGGYHSVQSQQDYFDIYQWFRHPRLGSFQTVFGFFDCMITQYNYTVNLGTTTYTSTVNIRISYMSVAGGVNAMGNRFPDPILTAVPMV